MNIYNLIAVLVFLLIAFGVYKLFRRGSKNSENQQPLSEADLKPFLDGLSLDIEVKVRKQWLASLFAFTGITALSIFFIYFGDGAFNEFSENTPLAFSLSFGLFLSSLVVVPWFWITYYCSYKKRGTVWLIWTMISLPLRELSSIGMGEWNQAADWDSLSWFMVITFLGIEVLYWVNCLRLLRVNSARECQTVLALKAKYGPEANGFCS